MKITKVEAYPVWDGHRNFLFVVVDTSEGISGIGEAGITGRELAVMGAIEHFTPLLIGQNPARIEYLWQLLFRGGFFPAQGVTSAAISAIDIALWDIKGKTLGVPIYELLGGRVRDKVLCYPHNDGKTMELTRLVESCVATTAEGWKFVRWGLPVQGPILEPRRAIQMAIAQFRAVREAVGDETFDSTFLVAGCGGTHLRMEAELQSQLLESRVPDGLVLGVSPKRDRLHIVRADDPGNASHRDKAADQRAEEGFRTHVGGKPNRHPARVFEACSKEIAGLAREVAVGERNVAYFAPIDLEQLAGEALAAVT